MTPSDSDDDWMDPDDDPNSGRFIMEHLKRSGSDITREHEVYFYLYFPSESLARDAASRVEALTLTGDVSSSSSDGKWLCLVSCPQIPEEHRLDSLIKALQGLAVEYCGEYDGWEASLELGE